MNALVKIITKAFLLIILLAHTDVYGQTCVLFGRVTDPGGNPVQRSRIVVRDIIKSGQLIDKGPHTYYTNSNGWFYIPAPQNAKLRLWAHVVGFDSTGGNWLAVPASDSARIDTVKKLQDATAEGLLGIYTSQYGSWNDAWQQAEALGARLIVNSAVTVSAPTQVFVDVTIIQGGSITANDIITFYGTFVAPLRRVFYGTMSNIYFAKGSVSVVPIQWFGASSSSSTDSYAAIQAAIDAAERSIATFDYDLSVYFSPGTYYVSDTLTISDHGIKVRFNDAILRPYGTFAGPLIYVKGDQATRTARIPGNWHRARVDIRGLYIDGMNIARGIAVDDVMQGLFEDPHFERINGYAVKLTEHKEALWTNLNIQTSDAGADSALLWIGDETGSEDGSNALVFISPKITYCGGRYVYIGNNSSIDPRLITFVAPQFHHLDTDPSNANPNVAIDSTGAENVVWIENGENIHFSFGLIRMPAAPKGSIVRLGSATKTPIAVTFWRTKISSDADSVTALDIVSAGRVTLNDVHFVLHGSGAVPYKVGQIWRHEKNNPLVLSFDGSLTNSVPGLIVANTVNQSAYNNIADISDTSSVILDVTSDAEPFIKMVSSKGLAGRVRMNTDDSRMVFDLSKFVQFDSMAVANLGFGLGTGNNGLGRYVIAFSDSGVEPTAVASNAFIYARDVVPGRLSIALKDETGVKGFVTHDAATQPVPASTGSVTINSGSVNPLTVVGWAPLYHPSIGDTIWVPYVLKPNP